MIRGFRGVSSLTYSQTLNGYVAEITQVDLRVNVIAKWAIFGKQNWR